MKRDLYQSVTDRIVAQMESGVMPWEKAWSSAGSAMPMNATTDRPYSGINVLLFWMARDAGYAKTGKTKNRGKRNGRDWRPARHLLPVRLDL